MSVPQFSSHNTNSKRQGISQISQAKLLAPKAGCKPFFNNLAVGNKRFSAVLQAQSALITANSTANFVSSERKLEWD
jgi:hypothetical protein